MAKATTLKTSPVVVDKLWQGVSGTAPWQRRVGQVDGATNIRFDRTLGVAAKRNATDLITSPLLTDGSASVDSNDLYFWTSVRSAVIAIGLSDVHGWDDNGDPLDVTDNTSGAFYDYLTNSSYPVTDPVTEIAVTAAQDTVIVANRLAKPRTVSGWSLRQCYNYILDGTADHDQDLADSGFQGNRDKDDGDRDKFRDFEDVDDYYKDNQAKMDSGRVIQVLFDSNLDPAGYYIFVEDDDNPYSWANPEDEIFPRHVGMSHGDKPGNWYRVPNGKAKSGTGRSSSSPDDRDEGQVRARWDETTMPHQITYDEDAGTLTIDTIPWWHRLSGNKSTNPESSFAENNPNETIRDVAFHQGRLFLMSGNYLVGSRRNSYYNLFADNISVPVDSDRIDVPISRNGKAQRAGSIGNSIFITSDVGPFVFSPGEEVLTSLNGRVYPLTDLKIKDIEPGYGANEVFVIDTFDDVHKFEYRGSVHGIQYTALLTAHYRGALYDYTPQRVFYEQGSLFIATSEGPVVVHDMFMVGDELEQSAWSIMDARDEATFFDTWDGKIRIITRNLVETGSPFEVPQYNENYRHDIDTTVDRYSEFGMVRCFGIYGIRIVTGDQDIDENVRWKKKDNFSSREDYMRDFIDTRDEWIADPNFDGLIAIDWEGGLFRLIKENDPTNPNLALAVADARALIAFLKSERPLAKVAINLMPIGGPTFTRNLTTYLDAHENVIGMLDDCDFFSPNMYHATGDDINDTRYVNVLSLSLALANNDIWPDGRANPGSNTTTRGVYCYASYRYGPNEVPNRVMPLGVVREWYRAVLDFSYRGYTPDSFISWHGDPTQIPKAFKTDQNGDYVWTGRSWDNRRIAYSEEGWTGNETEQQIKDGIAPNLIVFYQEIRDLLGTVNVETDNAYSLLNYLHREAKPPAGLIYKPAMDRMEVIVPTEMTYDSATDETTLVHTGRNGDGSDSMVVQGSVYDKPVGEGGGLATLVFIPVKNLDENGDPIFRGDLRGSDVYLGFRFGAEVGLTRLYPAMTAREMLVKELAIFHFKTTDYRTKWTRRDGQKFEDKWQGARTGVTLIGSPLLSTHFHEVPLDGTTSMTDIEISSSSPGPMMISALEFLVMAGGRGSGI